MLEKVVSIKNIAKFHNYNLRGDIHFQKFTVIYGDNGKGKSSLAGILRALSTGDTAFVLSKKTIGSTDEPYIKIKHSNGVTEFKNGMWEGKSVPPSIIVFDSTYINENVFSGNRVEHNHKKNLYYLVIGEKSVNLASDVEELTIKIKETSKEIGEIKKWIEDSILGNMPFAEFLALGKDDQIDKKIEKQQEILSSVKKAKEIADKPKLEKILTPEFNYEEFISTLRITLDDLSKDVEVHIEEHCGKLGIDAEVWIEQGMNYCDSAYLTCPFCGEPITSNKLIRLYSQFFSAAYKDLKEKIKKYQSEFLIQWDLNKLIEVQKVIGDNDTLFEFWRDHIEFDKFEFNVDALKHTWNSILLMGKDAIKEKLHSPLDELFISDEFESALKSLTVVVNMLQTYNLWCDELNLKIEQKKVAIGKTSVDEQQKKLDCFKNIKIRYSVPEEGWCIQYVKLVASEAEMKGNKEQKRSELKKISEATIVKYQTDINRFLENFGADFGIRETKTSFQGNTPSASYSLFINGESIPLGSDDSINKPAFRTTLSEGEKSALAFAFFLAQLQNDSKLKDKIVVIDDPVTSLDEHRKVCTKQEILKVAQIAAQVIVLSHDPYFLKNIKNDVSDANSLCITRNSDGSTIDAWDVELATMNSYRRDFYKLKNFLEKGRGDTKDVARCIRPLLEYYLRMRFPEEFEPGEWLGDFIKKIRTANPSSSLVKFQTTLGELSDINDYSKKFHHSDPDHNANLENLTDSELRPWVNRTLAYIRST